MQALLDFCKWLETTPWGFAVRNTLWGYPYVQLIHFSGLSLWVGTIAMLDLRLLGLGARRQTAAEFADQLFPWTWTGLGIVVLGGGLLFSSTATTYFHNPAFQIKLLLVLVGIVYHIVVQRSLGKWSQSPATPPLAKLAGLTELALWIAVITAAVEIPNY